MGQEQKLQSYIPEDGSAELVGAFFKSAAVLYRAAPWESLSGVPMSLDVPGLGVRGACLCWLSESVEEAQGALLVYSSFEAYQAALTQKEESLGPNAIALLFQEKSQLEAKLRREVRQHRWELVNDVYPRPAATDSSSEVTPLDARAYTLLSVACEAVSFLLSIHSHQIRTRAVAHLNERLAVPHLEDGMTATISYPHPSARPQALSPQPTWQEQLIEAFCSMEPKIKEQGLTESATYLCAELLEFKSVYQDEEPLEWEPKDISEFMLSYFPYRVMATPTLVQETPSLLAYFFRWLEQIGHVKSARGLTRQITTNRPHFLRYANDPRFFGEAKANVLKFFRQLEREKRS